MPLAIPVAILAVIAVGLVAIVILYGYKQLLRSSFEVFRELPVVGGWVAGNLERLLDTASHNAGVWAQNATKPIVDLLYRWVTRLEGHTRAVNQAHAASLATHRDTRQVQIPAARDAAVAASLANDARLEERTTRHLQEEHAHADAIGQTAQQYADGVGAAVRAYALALAVQNVELERRDLAALAGAVQALVAASLAQAQADAREQDAIAAALLTALVRTAEAEARDLVAGLSVTVAQVSLDDRLYAQQQAAAVGVTAASAIAVVATAVDTINRSPCMQRCATLGNLGAALEAIDLLALLGLAVAASRHPRAVGRDVTAVLSGPMDAARAIWTSVGGRP